MNTQEFNYTLSNRAIKSSQSSLAYLYLLRYLARTLQMGVSSTT